MNKLQTFLISFFKIFERGEMPAYPDPIEPTDIGSPLTQDEIDNLKRLLKEMQRFDPAP
jgi:hypothetical protein